MFNLSNPRLRAMAIWGGALFVLNTLQYAIAQIVVAAAWNPPYNWSANFISDLGNTACGQFAVHGATTYVCSPLYPVMNASFILSGLLTIAGTVLLWRVWPQRRIVRVALILWLIAGVLKIVVGLVPENTVASLHLLGAFNLPLLSVAILLLSISVRRVHRSLAQFGWAVSIVGIVGAVLSTAAQTAGPALNLGLGNGGMERLAGYPGNIWMLVVGALFVFLAMHHSDRAESERKTVEGANIVEPATHA
jgi:hypothetical membrane protein